jgi:hypothetical protein
MTITTGTPISAPSYGDILTTVTSVMSAFYGATLSSTTVTSGISYIRATDWNNLRNDINRGIIHQTGAGLPFGAISTGSVLTSSFVNSLTNYATQLYTNRAVVAGSQIATAAAVTSARTTAWGSGLKLRVQYSWENATAASAFFNQGGSITPTIALPTPSVVNAIDSDWKDFINFVSSDLVSSPQIYNASSYNGSAPSYTQTRNITPEGPSSISISYTKVNAYTIIAEIQFYPEGNSLAIGSLPSASLTERYSNSALGGIEATRPAVQILENLSLGGQTVYPILSFAPISTPSINQYNTGTVTVTVTNGGTGVANISGVVFTPGPGTSVTQTSLSISTSTISVGGTAIITLVVDVGTEAKDSVVKGSYITINSDNANGAVIAPFQINITYPIFKVTVSPTSVSSTLTVSDPVTKYFTFSPGLTGGVSSISASISNSTNFALNVAQPVNPQPYYTSPGSINVVFTPPGRFSNTNITGTHATTLTVTFNPIDTSQAAVTYTVPISYVLNIVNQNLGTWISARDQKNNIAGFSYDIIGGKKYITVGYGMGGDDSKVLSDSGSVYASIKNLLPSADPDPSLGVPLYASTSQTGTLGTTFGSFLAEYGSWITPNGGNKYGTSQDITYTFTAPAGTATFEFSAADSGDLYINGNRLASWSDVATSTSGSVGLNAGENTVRIVVATSSNRAASFGVNIKNADGTSYWNTKKPRRVAYYGWAEVYRIPILNNAALGYLNGEYPIKLTDYCNGFTYSHWCGQDKNLGSMFVIFSDVHNNITVRMNPISASDPTGISDLDLTLALSIALPYYYSNILTRYSNLESPIDYRYTKFFLGFNNSGGVRTSKVPFPYLITIINAAGEKKSFIANLTLALEVVAVGVVVAGVVVAGLAYAAAAGLIATAASTAAIAAIGGTAAAIGLGEAIFFVAQVLTSCFTKGTMVSMADDTLKCIEDVKVGDLVYNKDKTKVNKVTYVEIAKDLDFGLLYSPTASFKPFATVNHPLYIGEELTCIDPDRNYATYPWLGKNNKLKTDYIASASGQDVYNLWVDGDNTYIVNGYGTHSIIGDGGWALKLIEQGIMPPERLLSVMTELTADSKEAAYGIYLANKILGFLDIKLVNKIIGGAIASKDETRLRKTIKYTVNVLGTVGCFITRK